MKKNIIQRLAKLERLLDDISYEVDDNDPRDYRNDADYCKYDYTVDEVMGIIEKVQDEIRVMSHHLSMTADEQLEYNSILNIESEHLVLV